MENKTLNRVDFVNDDLYATDCGPACAGDKCISTLYVYLVDTFGNVTSQCVACHRAEWFRLDPGVTLPPSIGDIKKAHFERAIRGVR